MRIGAAFLVAAAVGVMAAGCAAPAAATPTPTPGASQTAPAVSSIPTPPRVPTPAASTAPTPAAPATAAQASAAPPPHLCPFHGSANRCLGPISAGTYSTVAFTPPLTYTVPDGWTNYEDLPGNFNVGPPGSTHDGIDSGLSDYIGAYTSIAAPLPDCNSAADESVPATAQGYVAWLEANPKLNATQARPITVDGLQGFSVDVALALKAKGLCSDPSQNIPAFAEVAIGLAPSDFSASVFATVNLRVEVFDLNQHVLAILLSDTVNGGSDYPDFWSAAQPVVDSFKFGP